jgi:uncharacterized protein YggU (UPF0235/DUF167 family)
LKVAVTQAPEKGKANKAIEDFLSKLLGLRGSQISLQSGFTSRRKTFLIREISRDELQRRLQGITPTQ